MDFQELVGQARAVEKGAEEKKPYSETVELPKTIDFSPEQFVDKNYQDLINEYERMVKIAKAGKTGFRPVAARIEVPEEEKKAAAKPELKTPAARLPPLRPPELKPPAVPIKPPEKKIAEIRVAPPPEAGKAEIRAPAAVPKPEAKAAAPEAEKEAEIPKPEKEFEEREEKEAGAAEAKPELEFEKKAGERPAQKKEQLEKRISELMAPPYSKAGEEKREEEAAAPEAKEFEFEKGAAGEEKREAAEEGEKAEREFELPGGREAAKEKPKPHFEFEFEKGAEEEKVPEEVARPPPEPEGKPEEAETKMPEAPKAEVALSQETKEVIGEATEIPYLTKHEKISLAVPPLLSVPPEKAAEERYAEMEERVPRALEKANEGEIKKHMIELTKELFKEKSINQRQKIKEEIARLREMLSRKPELPKRTVSYATSLFNAMEVGQKMEIADAKDRLTKGYKESLTKTLNAFSSSLKLAKGDEERKQIYDLFASDLEALKGQVEALSDRYESFFLREHAAELDKLRNAASLKSDKYMMEKAGERAKEIKFTYAAEFLALEDAVRKELSSLAKTKKHEALEARMSEEVEKVLSIVNMNEDELLKYMHARHQDRYYEFEQGKMGKLELLAEARVLMAKEAGIKKDIINKYFGEI